MQDDIKSVRISQFFFCFDDPFGQFFRAIRSAIRQSFGQHLQRGWLHEDRQGIRSELPFQVKTAFHVDIKDHVFPGSPNTVDLAAQGTIEGAGLTPLTNEELKTAIPDELIGLKRSKLSVGNQLVALSTAEATYTDADKNKKIELTIMDGAGETGSAFMSLRVMGLAMEREEETESGFSKITDIQGHRAEVKQNTYNEQTDSEIGFVAKDRYHISLQGSNMTLEELEGAVRQLNLSELK